MKWSKSRRVVNRTKRRRKKKGRRKEMVRVRRIRIMGVFRRVKKLRKISIRIFDR